ncbi:two-component system WalR/WalK regulatory protein YycI [Pullulanibacillus camelliae]|uniref:Two-component system WalR/WalK regulatory protein YycI n=1 Tax=Pullulanibacillus camelliae TaxID=1707096 RepID=A0A8J3E0F0_9BACL|nr:two-component system regulatory protein YycI [Pullulanibacillus camelliae]GGE53684.1 two-component system WalR/WalK regulatory protein YycI [Pullulanibacillus camelliae]
MNWGQTKTIFILCFFLLDIFLGYHLWENHHEYQERYESGGDNNFDQLISSGSIDTSHVTLPSSKQQVTFLEGTPVDFTSDSVHKALEKLSGPKGKKVFNYATDASGVKLSVKFTKPVSIPKDPSTDDINSLLKKYVYQGDHYNFWKFDKKGSTTTYHFVQTYNDYQVYSIPKEKVSTLNVQTKNGKAISYDQTYIHIQPANQKMTMPVTPMEAIQQLWEQNYLPITKNPSITTIHLCYINMVTAPNVEDNATLNYIPAWYIKVKLKDGSDVSTKEYFVSELNVKSIDDQDQGD